MYSLAVLWFARDGHARWCPNTAPWYRGSGTPASPTMLAALRHETLAHNLGGIYSDPATSTGSRKADAAWRCSNGIRHPRRRCRRGRPLDGAAAVPLRLPGAQLLLAVAE